MMSAYFLAEIITIHDPEHYQAYVAYAGPIIQQYGGEYLFRSEHLTPVSGEWHPKKLILIRFESLEKLHACFHSQAYRAIAHLREHSTTSRAVIIEDSSAEQR
jgi:uncharacterized protein (DUF1330 family)